MRARRPLRYLAPIALVVVLIAVVVVVATGPGDSKSKTDSSQAAPKTKTKSGKPKKFYRVRPGDLLSEIAEKTGVDTVTITKLNPELDAQALQAGQLIRLRK